LITFKTLKWKNFLSTGNAFTEIDFTRSTSTLIVGENGSGKSTMLDALCFVLFNKPFRAINKPQLVNAVNDKALEVEIEFAVGTNEYKIRRGIKPNYFEIYCNAKMIDQDAALRDMQKYLEEAILKLNYKSFTQIVILGSASFTPFMQLPLGSRREIIEDILDIQIFTVMNVVLKEKINKLKDTIRDIESEVEISKSKTILQQKYLSTLENDKQTKIADMQGQINAIEDSIKTFEEQATTTVTAKDLLGNPKERIKKLRNFRDQFTTQITKVRKELDFYEKHNDCPTCKQGISHDFKAEIKIERHRKIGELQEANKKIENEFTQLNDALEKFVDLSDQLVDINNEIITNQKFLTKLNAEISHAKVNVADITEEKDKLKALAKVVVEKEHDKSIKNEEGHYLKLAASLLKDTGIKTRIIRQYLPAINALVNKYLASMDFFVQFDLDEKFNETIKSRHRDKFSYASFSEGEKQRIDLALLFTWRTIAKMKNSAATNLLILDEVFDSSLDNNGTDYVMSLLNTIGEDANVFVISHKGDILFDKFRSVIKFEKKQNYSVIS
jgi:DNA repair exonuclease SbcCD ATPase subunit|tara:strand:+ start:95 stop:1765 length:1671 start_codon:yes stop_codon:yes gene_type:complete